MRPPLARRSRLALLVAATVLFLTGCVKLDVDLTVGEGDTVSGTYILAIDRSVLQLTGQDADQFYNQLSSSLDTAALPEGASADVEKYDQDNFVGAKITVKNIPISELSDLGRTASADSASASASTSTFTLTHDGDLYHFRAVIDTSSSALGNSPISIPAQVTSNAELRVKMTFPGEVTETNGSMSGTSVTWEPKLGDTAELTATAKDSGGSTGGGGSSNTLIVIVAVIAGLAVVIVLLVLLLARGRRENAPPPPEPVLGPPPGLGSLGAPPPSAAPAPPTTPSAPAPAAAPAPPPPPAPSPFAPPPSRSPPAGGQPLPPPSA